MSDTPKFEFDKMRFAFIENIKLTYYLQYFTICMFSNLVRLQGVRKMNEEDSAEISMGLAVMSYYWLDNKFIGNIQLSIADPQWKEKIGKRDVKLGETNGFVLVFTSSQDSPDLMAFCEKNGTYFGVMPD
jgi:hypothetical protein